MTKIEIIKETIGGIAFCLLFGMLLFIGSLGDGFDEVIINTIDK